jgi:MFS family permease
MGIARIARSVAAGMITLAFPYFIIVNLHYNVSVIGLIYVAATIATAILSFAFGVTTDTWGKRNTLLITSALLPISALMVYFAPNLPVIVIAAMLGGYSATGSLAGGGVGGAVQPVQNAVLADLVPKEKRTAYFSFFSFLTGATAALGSLLVRYFTVHALFLGAAIIAGAGIPFLWFVNVAERHGELRRLATKRTISKFSATGMLNGFAQGLIVPFLVPFFLIVYHLPKNEMSVYAFWSGIIGASALLAAPLFERTFGFVRSMLVTRGASTALFVLFPVIRILPFSVFIYLIGPAFRVAAVPIQQAELTRRVNDDEMGRALGTNQVARLLASSAGTGASGYLMEGALLEIPFFAYGIIMAANLYLYVRFFGNKGGSKSTSRNGGVGADSAF